MKNDQTSIQSERHIVAMHVGEEAFGIDIACIDTVITPQPITPVPRTPAFVKGVMNLRGRIVPVIDVRTRFGIAKPPEEQDCRIVVVEAEGVYGGLVVDNVSEVLRLPESSIQPPSELLNSSELEIITGIGRMKLKDKQECFILLLDVAKLLTSGSYDLTKITKLKGAAA